MYLWINLSDLSDCGAVPGMGSPATMLIRGELGDNQLPGVYYNPARLDESFVVVETSQERCEAIDGGLQVIGKYKNRRLHRIRTRVTAKAPDKSWRWVGS